MKTRLIVCLVSFIVSVALSGAYASIRVPALFDPFSLPDDSEESEEILEPVWEFRPLIFSTTLGAGYFQVNNRLDNTFTYQKCAVKYYEESKNHRSLHLDNCEPLGHGSKFLQSTPQVIDYVNEAFQKHAVHNMRMTTTPDENLAVMTSVMLGSVIGATGWAMTATGQARDPKGRLISNWQTLVENVAKTFNVSSHFARGSLLMTAVAVVATPMLVYFRYDQVPMIEYTLKKDLRIEDEGIQANKASQIFRVFEKSLIEAVDDTEAKHGAIISS